MSRARRTTPRWWPTGMPSGASRPPRPWSRPPRPAWTPLWMILRTLGTTGSRNVRQMWRQLTNRASKSTIFRRRMSRWPSSETPCRTRWRNWWRRPRTRTLRQAPSTIHRIRSRLLGRSAMRLSSTYRSVSGRWRGCVRKTPSPSGPPRRPEPSSRPRSSARRRKRLRNRRTRSAISSRSASRGRAIWPCARTTPRSRNKSTPFCPRPGSRRPIWTSYRCS